MRILPALLATGCASIIDIPIRNSAEIVVERGTLVEGLADEFGFGDFTDMDISASQELANQGVEPGDIKEVRFKFIRLTATAPGGAELGFIESLDFSVTADDEPTTLVASSTDFEGQTTIDLDLEDVDLTPWVVAPSMDLTTDVNGSRPPDDTTILAEFELIVNATTRGVFNQL